MKEFGTRTCLNYYVSRLRQEISRRTFLDISRPTFVWLKPTERCNCRCLMCEIWQVKAHEPELQTADWMRVIRDLRRWLGPAVLGFQGGEVFLRRDMLDLINFASSLGLKTTFVSNGTLLDDRRCRSLVEGGLAEVRLSLDSLDPELHDRLRGRPGTHEAVSEAVKSFVHWRDALRAPVRVVVQSIVMGCNVKDLVPLAYWARNVGLDAIKFVYLEPSKESDIRLEWFQQSELWPHGESLEAVESALDVLLALKAQGFPIENPVGHLQAMKDYYRNPEALLTRAIGHNMLQKSRGCLEGVASLVIYSTGDVRMCYWMEPVGNIRERPIREIWRTRSRCWRTGCSRTPDSSWVSSEERPPADVPEERAPK